MHCGNRYPIYGGNTQWHIHIRIVQGRVVVKSVQRSVVLDVSTGSDNTNIVNIVICYDALGIGGIYNIYPLLY